MSHFAPNIRSPVATPYSDNASRMEGAKANFSAALLTSEACMNKCNLTDASAQLSVNEGDCLRLCYVKYFDCQLLIKNELTNFVRGIDM